MTTLNNSAAEAVCAQVVHLLCCHPFSIPHNYSHDHQPGSPLVLTLVFCVMVWVTAGEEEKLLLWQLWLEAYTWNWNRMKGYGLNGPVCWRRGRWKEGIPRRPSLTGSEGCMGPCIVIQVEICDDGHSWPQSEIIVLQTLERGNCMKM